MRRPRVIAPLAAAAVILGAVLPPAASATVAVPRDPSPYCRDAINRPWTTSLNPAGGGHYDAHYEGDASITCNGAASVTVTLVLHYKTDPCSDGCGAKTGATFHCNGSCDPTVGYVRSSLFCGYHYSFDDYVQITGTWTGGGHSGTFSGDGPHGTGTSYMPPTVC